MGLWILEPPGPNPRPVPGTVPIFESGLVAPVENELEAGNNDTSIGHGGVKGNENDKKKKSDGGVVLVPQPSESVNDPLVGIFFFGLLKFAFGV